MKKLIVFAILMINNLTVFSQQDMDTIQIKCFPRETLKLIVEDLVKGDLYKSELYHTEKELIMTLKGVQERDSIILTLNEKTLDGKNMLDNQVERYKTLENNFKSLQDDLKKEKGKNKFLTYISAGLVGVLTGILIMR